MMEPHRIPHAAERNAARHLGSYPCQFLILRGRPLRRRPFLAALRILDELRPLRQALEHHAPAQQRADHHVGRRELRAQDPRPRPHRIRQHVERGVVVAIAERLARRVVLAREHAVHHRRLGAARREEQPFQIRPAPRIAHRQVELGRRERVGEIGADRRHLGDDGVAMPQRRHLPHRIDREIIGLAVVAVLQSQEMDVIGLADLLEHPERDRGTGGRGVVEREVGHGG